MKNKKVIHTWSDISGVSLIFDDLTTLFIPAIEINRGIEIEGRII